MDIRVRYLEAEDVDITRVVSVPPGSERPVPGAVHWLVGIAQKTINGAPTANPCGTAGALMIDEIATYLDPDKTEAGVRADNMLATQSARCRTATRDAHADRQAAL